MDTPAYLSRMHAARITNQAYQLQSTVQLLQTAVDLRDTRLVESYAEKAAAQAQAIATHAATLTTQAHMVPLDLDA